MKQGMDLPWWQKVSGAKFKDGKVQLARLQVCQIHMHAFTGKGGLRSEPSWLDLKSTEAPMLLGLVPHTTLQNNRHHCACTDCYDCNCMQSEVLLSILQAAANAV